MLQSGGEMSKNSSKLFKKNIMCFVKESSKYFLVTDAYFYIPCYFTPKAYQNFKANNANLNLTDLQNNIIFITDWSLEMSNVNSANVSTSYGGIEIKMIVKAF